MVQLPSDLQHLVSLPLETVDLMESLALISTGSQAAGRAQFPSIELLQTSLLCLYLLAEHSRCTSVSTTLAVFTGATEEDRLWAAGLAVTVGKGAEVVMGAACEPQAMVRAFEAAGTMKFIVAERQSEYIGIF